MGVFINRKKYLMLHKMWKLGVKLPYSKIHEYFHFGRIFNYAGGSTGSFFTLDGSRKFRLKEQGFHATTIRWDSYHKTAILIGFQQDSLKRTLWKEFTFANWQFAGPWNTTPTATSRKDEPTNPCKARKKVTCNIQCITKRNRRVEYFFAECWNNYIILYVSVLKLLCNLTCWIFFCWMLK